MKNGRTKPQRGTPTHPGPGMRFHVLARDGFRCRYCGRTPRETELRVDHVNPVSNGGKASLDNLVTACKECNFGKSDALLPSPPP